MASLLDATEGAQNYAHGARRRRGAGYEVRFGRPSGQIDKRAAAFGGARPARLTGSPKYGAPLARGRPGAFSHSCALAAGKEEPKRGCAEGEKGE